jgi:AcrR family transcriptional regulator
VAARTSTLETSNSEPSNSEPSNSETGVRRPRADAVRNRARIVETASEVFAVRGSDASLEEIARGAGVGIGTLYRHFPTRDALLAGLLRARADKLVTRRDTIRQHATDPTEALAQWLDALGDWAAAFDGLPEPLRAALSEEASPLALTCHGYITTTEEFLQTAQRAGGARPEIRARELFLSVLATSWAASAAMADQRSRPALNTLIRTGWATHEGSRPHK